MSATTSIEWTDRTWNPTTGCDKVSPGCAHCYAEVIADRFWPTQYPRIPIVDTNKPEMVGGKPNSVRPRVFTDVQTHDSRLLEPLSWRKPVKVFVNSMSDLFHEDVPDAFIDRVFAVMALASRHTFQILTKRPDRMRNYVQCAKAAVQTAIDNMESEDRCPFGDRHAPLIREWPLSNVWLGVSVENQHFADKRIPLLLQTPAAVRFISAEPLLGPVALKPRWLRCPQCKGRGTHDCQNDPLVAVGEPGPCPWPDHLDWVIVGGESGPGARPFDVAWARSIVAQCQAAGVAVFVKQLGAAPFNSADSNMEWVFCNRKGGDAAEWPKDLRVREFPKGAV